MGVLLVALSMFSGIIMVTMNVVSLFRDSGTAFNPDGGAIIFGILQVCGVCTSSILVDRRGRRTLYAISSILSSLSLLTFGTYTYLNKKAKTDLSSVDWLPVASLSFYIFVNCLGMRTVPFLYIAEILPYSVCLNRFKKKLLDSDWPIPFYFRCVNLECRFAWALWVLSHFWRYLRNHFCRDCWICTSSFGYTREFVYWDFSLAFFWWLKRKERIWTDYKVSDDWRNHLEWHGNV